MPTYAYVFGIKIFLSRENVESFLDIEQEEIWNDYLVLEKDFRLRIKEFKEDPSLRQKIIEATESKTNLLKIILEETIKLHPNLMKLDQPGDYSQGIYCFFGIVLENRSSERVMPRRSHNDRIKWDNLVSLYPQLEMMSHLKIRVDSSKLAIRETCVIS